MRNYIEFYTGSLSDITFELLQKISGCIHVNKDEFLLEQGQVCKNLWFLKKGAIKVFEIVNGEQRNTHFFIEECFLTNYMSVLTGGASELFFQAVEDCELFQINYNNLKSLLVIPPYTKQVSEVS